MKKIIFYIVLVVFALNACDKEDDSNTNDNTEKPILLGNLSGVLISVDGDTIEGGVIIINGDIVKNSKTTTSIDGTFSFTQIPEGLYTIEAYVSDSLNSQIIDFTVNPYVDNHVTFLYDNGHVVMGTFLDPFGEVLINKKIVLTNLITNKVGTISSTYTNSLGKFYFYDLVAGVYELSYTSLVGNSITKRFKFVEGGDAVQVKFKYENGGTFTDMRDNHKYKFVEIGDQIWMAENLAYLPSINTSNQWSNSASNYYVYGYSPVTPSVADALATKKYETYGVLYNYTAANTACPSGWHLPTNNEWLDLLSFVDAGNELENGVLLKSIGLGVFL